MIKYICFLMFLFFHSAWSVHDEELYLVAEPEFRLFKTQPPEFRFEQPPKYIYKYQHWCRFRGIISYLISSSNPNRAQACERGIISTAAINTLAGFLCEHTENPEECEEKFVTEGILPEPTMLPEFALEKRALIESIAERIRLNSPSE